jgi:hypothetical protein
MRKAEARISALRAPTCPQLQAMIDGVFQEEWRAGERRQDAYDRADQQKLVRHPLLVAANRPPGARWLGPGAAARRSGSSAPRVPRRANRADSLGGRAM